MVLVYLCGVIYLLGWIFFAPFVARESAKKSAYDAEEMALMSAAVATLWPLILAFGLCWAFTGGFARGLVRLSYRWVK